MKINNSTKWKVVLGAGFLVSLSFLPKSHAEMVYEDEIRHGSPERQPVQRMEDRENLRQVMNSSEKARITNAAPEASSIQQVQVGAQAAQPLAAPAMLQAQPQYVIVQPAPQPAAQPVAQTAQAAAPEVQNLSKSEMLRRQRVREELRNEDLLQERLEELRLRDEKKRVDGVMGTPIEGVAAAPAPMGVQNEAIVAPQTERPGQMAAMPAAPAPLVQDSIATSRAQAVNTSVESHSDRLSLAIAPRFGVANMSSGDTANIDVRSRFSAGFGLQAAVNETFSLEASYSYNEYGVVTNGNSPNVIYARQLLGNAYDPKFEAQVLKQNVFELGMKLHLLGADSKIRPFVGAGGGYAKSYLNYDQKIVDLFRTAGAGYMSRDYEMTQFLGTLSTGVDVEVAKNVSVGATFKYYSVLSSSENQPLSSAALVNSGLVGSNMNPNAFAPDGDKRVTGDSLEKQGFYSITAGVTFSF